MNRFLKFFLLIIFSLCFATGLVYFGILLRIDEGEIEASIKENIEKNLPGTKLNIASFKKKLGLNVEFVLKDVELITDESFKLFKADSVSVRVPFMSMISGKGVNRIIVKNLNIESNKKIWKKSLPKSETTDRVISKISLPSFLVGHSTTLEISEITTNEINPKVNIKKLTIKRMNLAGKSAIEFVTRLNLPMGKTEKFEGEFRFVGETSIKKFLEVNQASIKGTAFIQKNKLLHSEIDLPTMKGGVNFIWRDTDNFDFEMGVDVEGIFTGPFSFKSVNGKQSLNGSMDFFADRFLKFYKLSSRVRQFDLKGIKIPLLANLTKEKNSDWMGTFLIHSNSKIPVKFDGEEVLFSFNSAWENQILKIETLHEGFGGKAEGKFVSSDFSLVERKISRVEGHLELVEMNLSRRRIFNFLGASSIIPNLNTYVSEVPNFKIDLKSNGLVVEGSSANIEGAFQSKYGEIIARAQAEFKIPSTGDEEKEQVQKLSFLSSRKLGESPLKNRYDFRFKNLDSSNLASLFPFFLSDLEGMFNGAIQYTETLQSPRIVSEGIVNMKASKTSGIKSKLISQMLNECKGNDLSASSMTIKGTIDKNILFLNEISGASNTNCDFKLSGTVDIAQPLMSLKGIIRSAGNKKEFRLKGADLNDFNLLETN